MLTAVETALKEEQFIRGALPSAGNSRLESLPIWPSADGAAAASAAAAAAASAAASAAAAALALAVETDSPAVLLDCIDMSYKILLRPIIASEATVTVKTVPMRRLLLSVLLPTTQRLPTAMQHQGLQVVKMHLTIQAIQAETTLTPRQAVSTQELILLDTASVDSVQVKTV